MRTDWHYVYRDCVASPLPPERMNDLVTVTREAARLGALALQEQLSNEAYHNSMAAEIELSAAVAAVAWGVSS